MTNDQEFSLIIPLWNEEKNIEQLMQMIVDSNLQAQGMKELVLVNNGSKDQTAQLIDEWSNKLDWVKPLHLKNNDGYGGGVYAGLQNSSCDVVAYIPGDLQVSMNDVDKIWGAYQKLVIDNKHPVFFVKGNRTVRMDGFNTRFVSKVYTFLANILLNVRVKDVNGLPKMFHKSLLDQLPDEKMKTFVFDAQLIYTARRNKWDLKEIPVTFHARRTGVSSWSKKKIDTYLTTIKQIANLKNLYED